MQQAHLSGLLSQHCPPFLGSQYRELSSCPLVCFVTALSYASQEGPHAGSSSSVLGHVGSSRLRQTAKAAALFWTLLGGMKRNGAARGKSVAAQGSAVSAQLHLLWAEEDGPAQNVHVDVLTDTPSALKKLLYV